MDKSAIRKLKRKMARLGARTGDDALVKRTGFSAKVGERGETIFRPGDLGEVEHIIDDLEAFYIYLWSAKDHLGELLAKTVTSRKVAFKMVEDYVDRHQSLKIVADVANTAKHGELRNSRTGKYIKLGGYVTSMPVGWPWESQATIEKKIARDAKAFISLEDVDGKVIGDAVEVAANAADAWGQFIALHHLANKRTA